MVPDKSISALLKKPVYASATDCVNPETLKTAYEVRFLLSLVFHLSHNFFLNSHMNVANFMRVDTGKGADAIVQ
jgi:hypothetical protein